MTECAYKHVSRIRWSMLVSHHAPCDYDRTMTLFRIRVCVRCLGMLGGALAGYCINPAGIEVHNTWLVTGSIALALPAAFDFTAHELIKQYRSSNFRRFITGCLFGIGVGACLATAWQGSRWPLFCLLAYLALMQVVIAGLFRISGHLDSYVARYEAALFKSGTAFTESEKLKLDTRGGDRYGP